VNTDSTPRIRTEPMDRSLVNQSSAAVSCERAGCVHSNEEARLERAYGSVVGQSRY